MAIDTTAAPKANGLKTALDIVIAPKEALESIRVAPTWGWAFIVSVVLAVGAYMVMVPAVEHTIPLDMAKQAATNPQLAALSPEQLQRQSKLIAGFAPFFAVITPVAILFFALLQAVIMLIFNAVGRGSGSFKTLWAASINIGVIYGLSQVVAAIVVLLRGADSFSTAGEIQRTVPSLALLAPGGASVKLLSFLATVNPFTIWAAVLVGLSMIVVARVPKLQAWLAGVLGWIIPSLIAVAFAK